MHYRRLESLSIVTALLLIALASYQLFIVGQGPRDGDDAWQAWVSFLERGAKARAAGDLVWRDVETGAKLSEGSSIFTGSDARAELSFPEGARLDLAANTLLRLERETREIQIDEGVIKARVGARGLELKLQGKSYQLEGSGAELQIITQQGQTDVSVLSGKVSLSSEGERIAAGENESLALVKDQAPTKTSLPIELVFPQEAQVLWLAEGAPLELRWTLRGPATELRLELARDLRFTTELQVFRPAAVAGELSARLAPGSYFWRVEAPEGRSRIGRFEVRHETAIALLSPAAEQVLELPVRRGEEAPVLIEWESPQLTAQRLELQINEELRSIDTTRSSALVQLPVPARIRWRVVPRDPERPAALPSQWSSFRVVELVLPDPPEWETRGPVDLSRTLEAQEFDLRWSGEASGYQWQVRLGDEVKAQEQTAARGFAFPALASGDYLVRVRGFDRLGRAGEWSKPLAVRWVPFEERAPEKGQRIVLQRPDQSVSFAWQGEGVQLFELARDEAFTDIVITREGSGKAKVVFPDTGTFYWRARSITPDGTAVYSKPRKVLVEPGPPLATPEAPPRLKREIEIKFKTPTTSWVDLILPRAHASEFETSVRLALPVTPDAKAYVVEIFDSQELQKMVFTARVPQGEFEWKGAKPGRYWWRYALVDAWGRQTAMSNASELNLVTKAPPAPERAKLLRPIRAVKLAEAARAEFAWTPSERAQSYHFQLARDDEFEELLHEESLNGVLLAISTQGWPRGKELYWRVLARHAWGETPSSTGRFVIGVPPVLTAEQARALPWRPQRRASFIGAALEPRTVAVELDDREFTGNIDGQLLNSFQLSALWASKRWALGADLLRQSGTVYEGEAFARQELSARIERQWYWGDRSITAAGAGATQASLSSYRLKTTEGPAAESQSALSPFVQLEHEYRSSENAATHVQLRAGFGDWSVLAARVAWRQHLAHRIFGEVSLGYERASLRAARGTNSYQLLGAGIGVGKSFGE